MGGGGGMGVGMGGGMGGGGGGGGGAITTNAGVQPKKLLRLEDVTSLLFN